MQDGNTFPTLPKRTIELPARQFGSFPASGIRGLVTRLWVWWLRAFLNRERYRLQVYGRAPKTPKDRGWGGRIRLHRAKRWGFYLDDKFQAEFDKYHRDIGEHEAARHYSNELQREREHTNGLISKCSRKTQEIAELNTLNRDTREQVAELVTLAADRLAANAVLAESRDDAEKDFRNLAKQRDNLKANVGELSNLAAERAETITRIQERLDIRTEVLRLLRVELNGKYIPWGEGTCQDMADVFEANGYGHIEPPQPGVTNQPPVASDTLNAHREGPTDPDKLNGGELVEGLKASGLNVHVIDEHTDFSKLPPLTQPKGGK